MLHQSAASALATASSSFNNRPSAQAAGGIGRALANDLAMAGAAVAVVARSIEQVTDTAASIERAGGRALALAADVTDRQAIEGMLQEVTRHFGPVDLLVNNAGIVSPLGPIWRWIRMRFSVAPAINSVCGRDWSEGLD